MNSPCTNCDKANIAIPGILKCAKPCNKGRQYYECEKALIAILSGKPITQVMKGQLDESLHGSDTR